MERKYKNVHIIKRILAVCLVVIFCVGTTACTASGNNSSNAMVPGSSITPAPTVNKDIKGDGENPTFTGVLSQRDISDLKMRFVDISTGTEYEVPYSGGTDIQDAYGKVKAAATMDMGGIYDVYVDKKGKATKIYGNSDVWARYDVSGITVDESSRKLSIGASNMVYESYTVVLSGDERISIAQLVDQDKLVIRGVGEKVYSVDVTEGHGYLKFTGVDALSGGYVSIGNRQLLGITPDMLVTAPVGTFTVNVRNGSLSSSKTVTISKDATTTVDFSEVQTDPVKTGAVNFSVTPSGAVMSIDGTEVDYSSPVSLTYGTHRIKLVANNYQEYSEIINVNSAYVTKVIDMTSSGTSTSTAADNTSGYKVSITAPKGAVLYVNSEYIGTVPCSFDKSSGKKTITLSQNGYNTVSYTISIANTAGDLTYAFPEMISGGTQETTTQVQVPTVTPATTKSSTKQSTKRR